jgi:DGQHR domain-containing protein
MATKEEALLAPLVSTDGERSAEYKRRRDEHDYLKVLAGGEAPYIADGWQINKQLKRQIRLAKQKGVDRQFEDRVWRVFYKMGYDDLNKGHSFRIRYRASDGSHREKQVDIFARDQETIVVGECKACDEYRARSLSIQIAEFAGLRKQFSDAIRSHYGREFKPKILWFFFTDKVLWSKSDVSKAKAEQIHVMTERELDYFAQLSEHLGRATKYQFLAEYLGGQKIPELKGVKVPAIRGKLGGKKFYSFVSTPDQLLKFCFVNHRTLADPLALPTYQRMVKKTRLKAIGEFIKSGGAFPTNILINFDERRPFDRKDREDNADVQFGDLHLPDKFKSAWIVDGQHRLYGYSLIDPIFSAENIAVIAFEGLKREEEANLFVTINHEQKSVPRTLLDELDADLKWGSSVPAQRLSSIAARVVQTLTETIGSPVFRRVIAQGMKGDEITCLTMPELKGGIVRSHLIGGLAQKRKMFVNGPLAAANDEQTVRRAAEAINLFLSRVKEANSQLWDCGRSGGLSVNVGIRALLLLFNALIEHAEAHTRGFKARNSSPTEIVDEVWKRAKALSEYLACVPQPEFADRFSGRYGSGGPAQYYFDLCEIVAEKEQNFSPEGLAEHIAAKDADRVRDAESTLKFIENRVTDIVIGYFKRIHGEKFWNYLGTKDMRVKAYERQQEEVPEKQLDLDAYLDFIDKKKIIERSENWQVFRPYFDIPFPNEKGSSKNLKWMDRLNELRRIVAHPHKRSFKADDLDFLEWIRKAFEEKLLAVSPS